MMGSMMPAPGFRAVERFRRVDYSPPGVPPVTKCPWCRSTGIRPPDEVVEVRGITTADQGQALRDAWTLCGHFYPAADLDLGDGETLHS